MSKVIYETLGENYKVPGLAYEDKQDKIRPMILDSLPSREDINRIMTDSSIDTITNPWTIEVVKGLRDYIPTTFKRITQDMPKDLFDELFGADRNTISEMERTLLQLQTEVETKSSTIDAAIIHDRMDRGTITNKIHVVNRVYNIGRLYGFLKERETPLLSKHFNDISDKSKWYDILIDVKKTFTEFLLEMPIGVRNYRSIIRKPDVSQKNLNNYPFVEWFKEVLGDNFCGALLYGSAARTDDPSQFSDYDNWVKVKDLDKAYAKLKGLRPSVFNGKVITHVPAHDDADKRYKHLGIHLIPEKSDYLSRYVRFLHDSVEFRKHTKVLYGEFIFPKVAMDEVVERGLSQAYIKLKTIVGSLNWAWYEPSRIVGKKNLYEFIVKNLRFFLQHSLNVMHQPEFRDKETLNKLLAERGLHIPEYKPDLEHIKDSLIYAMNGVLLLQKELYDHRPIPKMEFMVTKDIPEAEIHGESFLY